MNRPEQSLQVAAAAYLNIAIPDGIWFHVPNSSGNRGARLGAILKSMGVKAGVPDLVFVLPDGRASFIELKAGKGSQSPGQKTFQADCDRLGVPYAICRSVPEIEGTLKGWGFKLRGRVAA